jgi:ABC-2 type transport system permease protein
VSLYTQEYDAFISQEHYAQIVGLLTTRILNQRVDQIEIILRPLAGLEEHNLSPSTEPVRDQDNLLTMLLPYGVMVFFYFAIMGTASMMFSSFSKEKENRVLEILINSATPYQIMGGKIIALGLVGLFQVALNGMSALVMLKYSIEQFDLPIEYLLDFSILGWGLVFFIFGYLLYAALLSGVGALVPNIRETSQLTSILFLPGMIPFFLISILIDSPNGGLAVFLSLFPLTAPTTMLLRLSAAAVPLWQLGLALTLLAASALLVTHLAARLFRAQNLLSGQSFQVRRFVRALLGRA